MKQYAVTDSVLQRLIFKKLEEYQAMAAPHSMLCMTTYEIAAPFPLLVTILNDSITLGTEDIGIFHEQYRQIHNVHFGVWLIITRTSEQSDFIRTTLPIGHSIYIQQTGPYTSYDALAERVSDFVFRLKLDRAINKLSFATGSFRIDVAKCTECSQTYRIVAGIRLFKNRDMFNDEENAKQTEVFIPVEDFSYPLSRIAGTQVNLPCQNGKHICSLCNAELTVSAKDIIPEERVKLCLTADDCLRYLRIIS